MWPHLRKKEPFGPKNELDIDFHNFFEIMQIKEREKRRDFLFFWSLIQDAACTINKLFRIDANARVLHQTVIFKQGNKATENSNKRTNKYRNKSGRQVATIINESHFMITTHRPIHFFNNTSQLYEFIK